MRTKIAAVVIVAVALSAALGVSAFTSATVDRSANINVVTDDSGIIGLEDGTSGDLIQQTTAGALTVDMSRSGASGVNTEARFEFGNTDDANNQTAFLVRNNAGSAQSLNISYGLNTDDGNIDSNVQFLIYNTSTYTATDPSTQTLLAVVSEDGGDSVSGTTSTTSYTTDSVADGHAFNVVMVVDTHGVNSSQDLSGSLNVSA